jgi:hypothetical protein
MNKYTSQDVLGTLIYKAYTPTKTVKITVDKLGYKIESLPASAPTPVEDKATQAEYTYVLESAIEYLTNK